MDKSDKHKNKDKHGTLREDPYEFARYLFYVLQHSGTIGLETWKPEGCKNAPVYMYSKS